MNYCIPTRHEINKEILEIGLKSGDLWKYINNIFPDTEKGDWNIVITNEKKSQYLVMSVHPTEVNSC